MGVSNLRSILLPIANDLTAMDLRNLIFLSKDDIASERECEDIRCGRDLFDIYIKRDLINNMNIIYLSNRLGQIGRLDLQKRLCEKWGAFNPCLPVAPIQPITHKKEPAEWGTFMGINLIAFCSNKNYDERMKARQEGRNVWL